MSGKLIVVEGLDGSGKATQASLLTGKLEQQNIPVRKVSFPDYNSMSSALVKMYLGGEFGTDPEAVNAYAASSFYAVDRYASFKKDWGQFYQAGGLIIADRYTTSNAIHQCSKLPQEKWDTFLSWLFHYEYELLGIPKPDLVIYLKTDPAISQTLMSSRYHGDEKRKDIHERNVEYLIHCRAAAEYCAQQLGWRTVDCSIHQRMRSVEDIHNEVLSLL